jgi:hypothetical protein
MNARYTNHCGGSSSALVISFSLRVLFVGR